MTDPLENLNLTLALVATIGVLAHGLTADPASRQAPQNNTLDSLDENWECWEGCDVGLRDVGLRELDHFGDLDSEDREHGR
jgi:hypothetical protein